MKKSILLLFALSLFMGSNANSQASADFSNQVFFGLKVGFNNSNVWDSEGEEFKSDSKFGLAIGGFLSIPILEQFSFQPELLFSQKGFKGTGRILGGTYDLTRTTNYLDIPLMLAFKPVDLVTVLAGPQYSYLMKQKDEFANATSTIAQEQEFSNDNIRNNTFSFIAGVDVNIDEIVLSTRIAWDLMNNNGDGTSTTPRYKNAWWQLTVGYRFN